MAGEIVSDNAALVIAEVTTRLLAITAQAEAVVRSVASEVERDAKRRCPVLTGELQADIATTIETEPTAIEASIGTTLNYGPFIEHGTSKMRSQAFLLPAFVTQTAHLNEQMAEAINAALFG